MTNKHFSGVLLPIAIGVAMTVSQPGAAQQSTALLSASDTLTKIQSLSTEADTTSFNWQETFPSWFEPVEPFRLTGSGDTEIYYVGTKGLGIFFIPTTEGHVVIDGGMPGQGQLIAENIKKLGFDAKDVRILLNTHAHIDHSGGLAELKSLTGAQLIASEGDRWALESGLIPGSEDLSYVQSPPVTVDRVIVDGEKIIIGNVTMTARITPGHTQGCTSWTTTLQPTASAPPQEVLFFCSASVAANSLVNPPQYPGIVADYHKTFALTADWEPEVFLANHGEFFDLAARHDRLSNGEALAFHDRESFQDFRTKMKDMFERALMVQSEKAKISAHSK